MSFTRMFFSLLPLVLSSLPVLGQQTINPMHPVFAPLDAQGQNVSSSGKPVDADITCGGCHDVDDIAAHNSHKSRIRKADCIMCHADQGRLEISKEQLDDSGKLKREAMRIGKPAPGNCAQCHGVVNDGTSPVALPQDLVDTEGFAFQPHDNSLSLGEGAIVAPQLMSDSLLNLEHKDSLNLPWDAHAAKLVQCVACHRAGNNPVSSGSKRSSLRYLNKDPRRISTSEYLRKPDHRLTKPNCRYCHDALQVHDFLPYKKRHMEVLSCQACHIPSPMGPAAQMVDATVMTLSGKPVVSFRNLEKDSQESLNAGYWKAWSPLMLQALEADGIKRLAPYNLVTRFFWSSEGGSARIPQQTLRQAFLEGDHYAAPILAALDKDHNGRIDRQELRLDSPGKVEAVSARLRALGVDRPRIDGVIHPYPLAHGVMSAKVANNDCSNCHARDSRLGASFVLASYLPGGVVPKLEEESGIDFTGVIADDKSGGLVFRRESPPQGTYILGRSRHEPSNQIGFVLFLLTCAGCALHGLIRLWRRRFTSPKQGPVERVYLFGVYERLWHWIMTLSVTVLIVTGIEVHNAGSFTLLGLPWAVKLHNVFAVILMLNAFLALFYHLASAAIRQFIPPLDRLFATLRQELAYYFRGIFKGAPHPTKKTNTCKLNPLQQITYLLLLNLLFPLQIITGLLIWAVSQWPDVASSIGGLSYVAPLHNFGAWLFLAFFVLHHYLITTGHSLWSNLKSMITGYDVVECGEPKP